MKTPETTPAADVAPEDFGVLMSAVSERLRRVVGFSMTPLDSGSAMVAMADVHGGVLDCVDALERLQASLLREIARLQRADQSVLACEVALQDSRVELDRLRTGERRAWHLALHDGLTLLPNRRYLCDRLDAALTGVSPTALSLLYIDLDGFKAINDTHGHAVGDELLRIVAVRLRRAMRPADMVGRLGGDEFACLLQGQLDGERLDALARLLIDVVAMPVQIGALRVQVRPSIGIASAPADGVSAQSLLRCADAAMFRAKRQRCGHAFFGPGLAMVEPRTASQADIARSMALLGEPCLPDWLPTLSPSSEAALGPAHPAPAWRASQSAGPA